MNQTRSTKDGIQFAFQLRKEYIFLYSTRSTKEGILALFDTKGLIFADGGKGRSFLVDGDFALNHNHTYSQTVCLPSLGKQIVFYVIIPSFVHGAE